MAASLSLGWGIEMIAESFALAASCRRRPRRLRTGARIAASPADTACGRGGSPRGSAAGHVSRRLRRPGCGARALRYYGPRVERDRPDPGAAAAKARAKVAGIVRNLAKRRRRKAA